MATFETDYRVTTRPRHSTVSHSDDQFQVLSDRNEEDEMDWLIRQRDEEVIRLQAQFQEINGLFVDMHDIVMRSAPVVDNIAANITNAAVSTEKGLKEVKKKDKTESEKCNTAAIAGVSTVGVVAAIAIILGLKLAT